MNIENDADIELDSQDLKEVGSNRVAEIQDENEDNNVTPNKLDIEELEKTVETAKNEIIEKDVDDLDEVVEVPVSPKPIPEVVNIENDSNSVVISPAITVEAPNENQPPPNTVRESQNTQIKINKHDFKNSVKLIYFIS